MSKVFNPQIKTYISASAPHPAGTQYRIAIGMEDWNGVEQAVLKIQMAYNGKISGRKAPSIPKDSNDWNMIAEATSELLKTKSDGVVENKRPELSDVPVESTAISQIRLLPMGTEEFPGKASVDAFFAGTVTTAPGLQAENKYAYRYRKKAMRIAVGERVFVLFQYDGRLVACGEIEKKCEKQDGIYGGYYSFAPDTVKLFRKPITLKMFREIVPEITRFGQGEQIVDTAYLSEVLRLAIKSI